MDPVSRRYGGLGPAQAASSNAVIDLLLSHRTVRNYEDRPLPQGALELLVAAGQSGSTSSNMQTASIVAVSSPERKQRLAELAGQAFFAKAAVVLCFIVDQSRAARISAETGQDFPSLPLLDVFVASVSDCAIMAQNISVAAESMGLGICYLGGLRSGTTELAQMLHLPHHATVIFGLAIGYEADGPKTDIRPRLPQPVILHHETYDSETAQAALPAYDEVARAHEVSQGREAQSWSERHPSRFANLAYLRGRDRLREQLHDLGLPVL